MFAEEGPNEVSPALERLRSVVVQRAVPWASALSAASLLEELRNVRHVAAPEKRGALALLPSIATDHKASFRLLMLLVAPLLIIAGFVVDIIGSKRPLAEHPWIGFAGFVLILGVVAFAIWQRLRCLQEAIAAPPAPPNQVGQADG